MLRRATTEDAAALEAIHRAALAGAMPGLPDLHTADDGRRFYRDVVIPNEEVWIHDVSGVPAGFVALGSRDGVDYVQHLYVAPEHQRRGLGTRLLDLAKERRPDGFRLWVFQRNDGARLFYERHGCRLVELTDGSGNEEREPDALYEWVP